MCCRSKRLWSVVLAAAAAILMILFFAATPALADTADPDDVNMEDIEVYTYIYEEGDFIVIAPYTISYPTPPSVGIDDTFIFRLISDNGTELGAVLAYPYANDGYGDGIVSFYFSTDNAPEWEGSYHIRIEENPSAFDTPTYWDFPINSSAYSSFTTQEQNREALRLKIIDLAESFSTSWGIDLTDTTDTGTVLSSYGESYFRLSIWGLQNLCPALFYTQASDPDYTKRSWSTAFAESLANTFQETDFVWDAMTGFAGLWGMETRTALGFVVLIIAVLLFLLDLKVQPRAMMAWLDVALVLNFGMLMGWFSPILNAIAAFLISMTGAMVLWLNRA